MRFIARTVPLVTATAVLTLLVLVPGCSKGDKSTKPGPAGLDAEALASIEIPGLPRPEDPNKVVADVNGEPISAGEVFDVAVANRAHMNDPRVAKVDPEVLGRKLRQAALSLLVDNQLLLQAARNAGVEPKPDQVEAEFQKARAGYATDEEFEASLKHAGVTQDDLRREAAERVRVQQYVQSVTSGVEVGEDEARKFYDANRKQFRSKEQVHAAVILVNSSPDDPPARRTEARKRIEEARSKLQSGEDFAEVAREYSQAPTAAKGGDMGFFPRGVMWPEFEKRAFNTAPGTTTPIFETPSGFNILKVLEKREASTPPYEEVKPFLLERLKKEKQAALLRKKLGELRAAAKIRIVDPEYREQEPAAGQQGNAEGKKAGS